MKTFFKNPLRYEGKDFLLNKIRNRLILWKKRLFAWVDYQRHASNLSSFRRIMANLPPSNRGSLLIVSGRQGMNVMVAQIWSVLSLSIRVHGYRGIVLTNRLEKHLNRYYRLLGLELIYYEELAKDFPLTLPDELHRVVDNATHVHDYQNISYKEVPVGRIALSSYTRNKGSGLINLNNPEVVKTINYYIGLVCQAIHIAEYIYKKYNTKFLFFTETFFEEYGGFYYTALKNELNIIKLTGTVRDDAFLFRRQTKKTDRLHHAGILPTSWEKIKNIPFTKKMDADLTQNFLNRYGDKWYRSYRNHPNTRIMSVKEAKKLLGIENNRKVVVIFSHILYDNLFHYGEDLFDDYAGWLVETVRTACDNPELDWLVKVHPSNTWRGELNTLLEGKYEEEMLIAQRIGELPPHVRIVSPDTKINPFTWFQLADYGITVRGTSGLEMAALGKTVITAGTGRYEGSGFTIDPPDKKTYIELLKNLHDISPLTSKQEELAKRYAYALFILKPFTFTSLKPRIRFGTKKVTASDDLIYIPKIFSETELPRDIQKFSQWAIDEDNLELLSDLEV